MRILVTGGKSATALKLMKAFADDEIVLADYGDVPLFSSNAYEFISLGEKNQETLAHNLLNHCLDHHIDTLLPLYLFELEPIAKTAVLFGEFGIDLLLPNISNLQQYLNKINTSKNWTVFKDGEVVFTTEPNDRVHDHGFTNKLSGAYDHQSIDNHIALNLIYI